VTLLSFPAMSRPETTKPRFPDLYVPRGSHATLKLMPPGRRVLTRADLRADLADAIGDLVAATCLWEDDGWQLGDHRALVLSISPARGRLLVVQLWSEPGDAVFCEVSTDEKHRPAIVLAGAPAQFLEGLGFTFGGDPGNFAREVQIATRRDAKRVATEVLDIFYHAFGYRGGKPITATLISDGRAEMMPVYDAFTPLDLCKLLREMGCEAHVRPGSDKASPVVDIRSAGVHAELVLGDRVEGEDLYESGFVSAGRPDPTDVEDIRSALEHVGLRDPAQIRTGVTLHFRGGVTSEWVAERLAQGIGMARDLGRRQTAGSRRSKTPPTVH